MRLLGIRAEKSHFLYLITYQVFKSVFSIENETLRLFSQKNLLRKKQNLRHLREFLKSHRFRKWRRFPFIALPDNRTKRSEDRRGLSDRYRH